MKTQIKQTGSDVTLLCDDGMGGVIRRLFTTHGGYVKEWRRGNLTQVCEKLSDRGVTLHAPQGRLINLIRSEWRKR